MRAGFGKEHQVEFKGAVDLVTEIDRKAEAFLVEQIRARYPEHKIVAEESGGVAGSDEHVWYVDPLDGTVNYAHGLPIFCVSLAYAEAGKMLLGVVYDPMADECYSAERGKGARLNGITVRASQISELGEALLITGFPYDRATNPQNNLAEWNRFTILAQGLRRLGSAALDLCYVAAGRCDGFWEIRLNAWDVAAGGLIAEEAGAKVTNIEGGPDYLSKPQSVLAANPALHKQMLEVLRKTNPLRSA